MNQPFDITTRQPQLFVCRDFQHLKDVLEEFAGKMAFVVGGLEGINKEFGTTILVSGAVEERCRERFVFRALGKRKAKGREEAIEIFELVGAFVSSQ